MKDDMANVDGMQKQNRWQRGVNCPRIWRCWGRYRVAERDSARGGLDFDFQHWEGSLVDGGGGHKMDVAERVYM
jgi:hypothetical protein